MSAIPQVKSPKEWAEWILKRSREVRTSTLEWIQTSPFKGSTQHLAASTALYELVRHGGLFGKNYVAFKAYCSGNTSLVMWETTTRAAQRRLRTTPSFQSLEDVLKFTLCINQEHAFGSLARERENEVPYWVKMHAFEKWSLFPKRWWDNGELSSGNPGIESYLSPASFSKGRESVIMSEKGWKEGFIFNDIRVNWNPILGRDATSEEDLLWRRILLNECNRIRTPEFVIYTFLLVTSRTGSPYCK